MYGPSNNYGVLYMAIISKTILTVCSYGNCLIMDNDVLEARGAYVSDCTKKASK